MNADVDADGDADADADADTDVDADVNLSSFVRFFCQFSFSPLSFSLPHTRSQPALERDDKLKSSVRHPLPRIIIV